eukprot:344091-Chlamydomonas_euryale.AAC.2
MEGCGAGAERGREQHLRADGKPPGLRCCCAGKRVTWLACVQAGSSQLGLSSLVGAQAENLRPALLCM